MTISFFPKILPATFAPAAAAGPIDGFGAMTSVKALQEILAPPDWMRASQPMITGIDPVGGSGVKLTPQQRQERYQRYIQESVGRILNHFQTGDHDRGLLVSPIGLRDITQELLRRLVIAGSGQMLLPRVQDKRILLIVQGQENRERWRTRLEKALALPREPGLRERDIWQKNDLTIELISIHYLSRLNKKRLQKTMGQAGLVILDKEHHIRAVEDKAADEERKRFIRVLQEGGFLSAEFAPTRNPDAYLLGLTETVTVGAGRIYGGKPGLITSHTLPELLQRGLIHKPEVRVIVPQSFPRDQPVHVTWNNLELGERIEHSVAIIDSLVQELAEEGKVPRLVFYAGSREEAVALDSALEGHAVYRESVALLISGDSEQQERREQNYREFMTGTKKLMIHVETMVEGVDEFGERPVNAVIYSGSEYAGSLRYALQAVGAHLGAGEQVPMMIDQAGLFIQQPDLVHFDPTTYILEAGEMRLGKPLLLGHSSRERGKQELKGEDILTIDLFGEAVGRHMAAFFTTSVD